MRSDAESRGFGRSNTATSISPKRQFLLCFNQSEVGGRRYEISTTGVIVLIPPSQAAPEVRSQPSTLIWVEGPWPQLEGEQAGMLLPREPAFTDGEATVSQGD